jgi:activator of 2-hydroxyglutaryl-CoA dehydratase
MKTYIGLDVGSVSVKLAKIDERENLIQSVYLRNRVIRRSLESVLPEAEENLSGCLSVLIWSRRKYWLTPSEHYPTIQKSKL